MYRLLIGGLTLLLLAGCSTTTPAGPPGFPPRPADIDIAQLDPCTLLSENTARELGVAPQPSSVVLEGAETPTCSWGSLDAPLDYSVQLIPQGAAQVIGSPGTSLGDVEGYGTVRDTEREDSYPFCELLIDTSDTSLIRIQVEVVESRREDGSRRSIDDACGQADRIAREVVRTARAQGS